MSAPLHLLRPMTQWHWKGRHLTTIEEAKSYVDHIAGLGFDRFYTATTRAPRRVDELKGGSVYFVRQGHTLFRMPLKAITDDRKTARQYGGEVLIEMEPRLIRVEQKRVGFLRGWRYLEDRSKPADLPDRPDADAMPEEMASELKELGLA